MRVLAPAYPLGRDGRAEEGAPYINVANMRREMWRNNRFTLFSPF
jgi:hypothetical protein